MDGTESVTGQTADSGPTRRGPSVLASRIAAGLADPISDEEREATARLRTFYEQKFGKSLTKS